MISCQPQPIRTPVATTRPHTIAENHAPRGDVDDCARARRVTRVVVQTFYRDHHHLSGKLTIGNRTYRVKYNGYRTSDNAYILRAVSGRFRVTVTIGAGSSRHGL
jgi:hypothetical protein